MFCPPSEPALCQLYRRKLVPYASSGTQMEGVNLTLNDVFAG